MWTKFVKKKRVKTNKIWLKNAENTIRKIVKKPVVDFNSTNNEEFAKKKEKTIFGPRHPTLYFGIVIIKKSNRVAFIVMQDNGNTDHEQNLTEAKSNIWSRNRENKGGLMIYRKILPELDTTVCDNSARNFTKKKEKTIFGPRHPTLYIGIVIIFNRVAFIVMQDNGNTDYEQNLTDVRSGAAEPRTGVNELGSIQKVLVYYRGILSVINPDAARLKKVFLSNHNSAPEGFPRNGCWKGDSVCRNMMGIVPQ